MKTRLGLLVAALAATAALGGVVNGSVGGNGSSIPGGAMLAGAIGGVGGSVEADTSTFWLNPDGAAIASGPGNLSDTLVINGVTGTVVASYDARDISGTSWPARGGTVGTLSECGAGTSPTSGLPAPFTEAGARAVEFAAGGKTFCAANTSAGDVTTQDLVLELIGLKCGGGATSAILGKKDTAATAAAAGYIARCTITSQRINMEVSDGADQIATGQSIGMTSGMHVMQFYDAGDDLQQWINGAQQTASSSASAVGSLTNSATFTVGGTSGDSSTASSLVSFRVWTFPAGTLTDAATHDAVADARAEQMMGVYPATAAGSAIATTLARTNTKYIDIDRDSDGVRRMFLVYNNWIGVSRRKEETGGEYVSGVDIEANSTNAALQSEDFATTWTTGNLAVSTNTTAAPNMATTADALESTDGAGSVEHYVRQGTITHTAVPWTTSVYVKAGADASATHAWIRNNTVANTTSWLRLSDCTAGTKGSGTARITAESWGNGWCRFGITYAGTVAAHEIDIGYSNADNSTTYDDGTDSSSDLIVWGAQAEFQPMTTTYIATTTASASRTYDQLQFAASSNAAPSAGTINIVTMRRKYDSASAAYDGLIGVAADANNPISLSCNASGVNDHAIYSGGVIHYQQVGVSDCSSGEKYEIQIYWEDGRARSFVDGVAFSAEDNSVTAPLAFTTIFVGSARMGTLQTQGLIGSWRVRSTVDTTP
jgi:hypothetical protein